MDVIAQKLVVKDWPLKKPGDEKFFGYVVAVGVFPGDGSGAGEFSFADFAYNNEYTRYRLPKDADLMNGLLEYLACNLEMALQGQVTFGKVWVKLTEHGYKVELP